jgi:hypothetical protein
MGPSIPSIFDGRYGGGRYEMGRRPPRPESNAEITTRQISEMITWLNALKAKSYKKYPHDFIYTDRIQVTQMHRNLANFFAEQVELAT